jgi:2-methylcitrate dehydratase PrpD
VCNIQTPRTGLEAKFSLRFTVALGLAAFDTASLGTYSDARTADPRLAALRDRVEIKFVDGWATSRAMLKVTLDDGAVLEAEHDAGIAAADVGAQGRRVEAKFMSLATPVLGEAGAARLRDAVAALDELRSVGELMALAG